MTEFNKINKLALYHYQSCPYCAATRQVIDQTRLEIEQRDILLDSTHRAELIREGGKPQVPCLRIEKDNGNVQWLYESGDIIQFLYHYDEHTKLAA